MTKYRTHKDTAEIMGITPATLTAWVKQGCPCIFIGKITVSKRGARPRFNIEELEAWCKARRGNRQ